MPAEQSHLPPHDPETGEIRETMGTIGDTIRQALGDDEVEVVAIGDTPFAMPHGDYATVDEALENHHAEARSGPGETPQNDHPELPLNIPEHVPGESKADAFVRLAEHRMNTALKRIDLVGNLANRAMYDFAPDQVADVIGALREAVEDTARRFRVNSPRPEFRLRR